MRHADPSRQRAVARIEESREGIELVPQGLGGDDQALSLHRPSLSGQGLRIHVLGDRNGNRELERVSSALDELWGTRCRHDLRVAAAAILLPPVFLHHEATLDHRDQLGVLGAVVHRLQRPAAGVAAHGLLGEQVTNLLGGQRELSSRAVPPLGLARRLGLAVTDRAM